LVLEVLGEGDGVEAARTRALDLGIAERVWFSDRYLPQREVLARVTAANVGVVSNLPIPLNRFALSTKLFEYVALRVPVVCADLPTIRRHFNGDELRYFTAGDVRALADALIDVATDPAEAQSRARRAAARAAAYSWEANARRYEALLGELTGNGRTYVRAAADAE
jgi:glycosyltransferase involved in cell wall biosynthesis